MTHNPILDELRAAREKLLADAGGDLDRLVAGMRERQAQSGRKIVAGRVGKAREAQPCNGTAGEPDAAGRSDRP